MQRFRPQDDHAELTEKKGESENEEEVIEGKF